MTDFPPMTEFADKDGVPIAIVDGNPMRFDFDPPIRTYIDGDCIGVDYETFLELREKCAVRKFQPMW